MARDDVRSHVCTIINHARRNCFYASHHPNVWFMLVLFDMPQDCTADLPIRDSPVNQRLDAASGVLCCREHGRQMALSATEEASLNEMKENRGSRTVTHLLTHLHPSIPADRGGGFCPPTLPSHTNATNCPTPTYFPCAESRLWQLQHIAMRRRSPSSAAIDTGKRRIPSDPRS